MPLFVRAADDRGAHEVYVWQRQWTQAVTQSLELFAPRVGAVHVLAAEVSWRNGAIEIFEGRPDWAALKKSGVRMGLVVRIGPYASPFSKDDATVDHLKKIVRDAIARAREAGVEPVELQIDFDCAERKLAGYREWLKAFREVTANVPLVFTALPVWLRHDEAFRELASVADGFVLQVHSVEKPVTPHAPVVICDPEWARAWIEQADKVGRAFRVSLPTYGYEVGYDPAGNFIGLAAEGLRRSWPANTHIRTARTDAGAMYSLVQHLERNPPKHCSGVIWFRLPVDGDRLNWDARTLMAMMRSEAPQACLSAGVVWSETAPGLAEVYVENLGEVTVPLPPRVEFSWAEDIRVVAIDGLAGYAHNSPSMRGRGAWTRAESLREATISPGRRLRVGWIRFSVSHEIPVHIEMSGEFSQR